MKTKRLILFACALLAYCGIALADAAPDGAKALAVRTFQFKYKDADKAAAVVKPLMSAEGTLSMQAGNNALVITDRPENMKAIAAKLAELDTPAATFKLSIRLVSASRLDSSAAAHVSDDLKDVAPKLAMLRFNSLESLGDVTVEGKEGDPGIVEMPTGYRADFHFGEYDAASDTIKVNDLKLARLQGAQKDQLTSLLKTSLNLKLGQTVILSASKVPQSNRALMIVVIARR